MIRKSILSASTVALLPLTLAAQLPENAAERIQAAQERVAQAGIPLEMIELKIAEGLAKGAPEELIAAAAERRADALTRAQAAMSQAGRGPSEAELVAGAHAIEAGVEANMLTQVIEQARTDGAAVELAVLAELVRQGLPVDIAFDAVTNRGADALDNLPEGAVGPGAAAGRPAGVGRPEGVGGGPPGIPAGPPPGFPGAGQRPDAAGPPSGAPGGAPTGTPGQP